MAKSLPLSALLSHALVAFIIEFDNQFEHQVPHRTGMFGPTPGSVNPPYLLSMVMWTMFLRFVPDDGITIREFRRLAGLNVQDLRQWLPRLAKWWNYVSVRPAPAQAPSKTPGPDWIIRPTPGGLKALEAWWPLTRQIETRWEKRFGKAQIEELSGSLRALIDRFEVEPPGCLPILGYGLVTSQPNQEQQTAAKNDGASENNLPALLSKALLAFALEFERDAEVSLAISANVLRLVSDEGVRVADLPRLAGVSKEAVAMSVGFLQRRGYAVIESKSRSGRGKVLLLAQKGVRARETYDRLPWTIEERWAKSFGKGTLKNLRNSLERLVGGDIVEKSPLFAALEPYPDCWRFSVPKPETLPHFPMILHRGGYPDGS